MISKRWLIKNLFYFWKLDRHKKVQLLAHKELNKSFKFVCNVVSHCLSKLLEIKIYNSYEQLDIIKTELLGNSIEIEIKIEII